MKLVVVDDIDQLSRETTKWCAAKAPKSMFLPAGRTPTPVYQLWEKENPSFLKGIPLFQIDDVMHGKGKGQFKKFFEDELPSYLSQFTWIEEGDDEADVALLGLGLNGHVAFHEPGLGRDFFSGCVRLSDVTRGQIEAEPGTWGITYGAGAFNRCRAVCVIVSGKSKREILQKFLAGDPSLPVSALLKHADLTVITDRDAYP